MKKQETSLCACGCGEYLNKYDDRGRERKYIHGHHRRKNYIGCKVDRCNNKHHNSGYCNRHYLQMQRHGKILKRTRFDPNEINIKGNICIMDLYDKDGLKIAETFFDIKYLEEIKKYKWSYKAGYAVNCKREKLHWLVLSRKEDFEIDHIDRNGLNNTKNNLRYVTHQENSFNTKAKGFCIYKNRNKKYQAYIHLNNKKKLLGYYYTEQEARNAYLKAKKKYHKIEER